MGTRGRGGGVPKEITENDSGKLRTGLRIFILILVPSATRSAPVDLGEGARGF